MKILKKISLRRGLQRLEEPSYSYPKVTRWHHFSISPVQITGNEELHKYSAKPPLNEFKWFIFILLGSLGGVFWKTYEQELYTVMKLYLRYYVMSSLLFLEKYYHLGSLWRNTILGQQNLEYFTQAIIRYGQYQYYQQNKDRKFDFLEIGLLEKFPYPKRKAEMA